MKHPFLIIFALCLNITAYCQDESVIYKKIIDEYPLKYKQPSTKKSFVTLIVLEVPLYLRKIEITEFSRFKESYKKLDEKTFLDFIKKNQKSTNMDNFKFPDVDIVVVNQEQSKRKKELLTMYPNWNHSILEFSNIGFNEEKNQAFVYYGFDSGSGVGGGFYIIFEKKKGKWKNKAVIPAWAA